MTEMVAFLEMGPVGCPGLGGSRHHDEGAQAGTESVMNTDSSQLVTVVAVGQRAQCRTAHLTDIRKHHHSPHTRTHQDMET